MINKRQYHKRGNSASCNIPLAGETTAEQLETAKIAVRVRQQMIDEYQRRIDLVGDERGEAYIKFMNRLINRSRRVMDYYLWFIKTNSQ